MFFSHSASRHLSLFRAHASFCQFHHVVLQTDIQIIHHFLAYAITDHLYSNGNSTFRLPFRHGGVLTCTGMCTKLKLVVRSHLQFLACGAVQVDLFQHTQTHVVGLLCWFSHLKDTNDSFLCSAQAPYIYDACNHSECPKPSTLI